MADSAVAQSPLSLIVAKLGQQIKKSFIIFSPLRHPMHAISLGNAFSKQGHLRNFGSSPLSSNPVAHIKCDTMMFLLGDISPDPIVNSALFYPFRLNDLLSQINQRNLAANLDNIRERLCQFRFCSKRNDCIYIRRIKQKGNSWMHISSFRDPTTHMYDSEQ